MAFGEGGQDYGVRSEDEGELGIKNYELWQKIGWRLGQADFGDLNPFDLIVRNPAVYRYRPEIVEAEKAGVEVSSKTKIFFDVCPGKIIGVTGTKGKGTTTTLIYEILKAAGKDVYLGGNIGTGIFRNLLELDRNSWVVLELSSFQLIDLHKSPHIAYQTKENFAVVNKDYPNSVEVGREGKGKKIWVSGKDARRIKTRLRGEYNKENIAAALAVADIVGVPRDTAEKVVADFKSLKHRLEEVATVGGVTFYNDSFSTTPETAIAAIKSFAEPEILILGGSTKYSDFTSLGETIARAENIKAIVLIGEEGERIKQVMLTASARGGLWKGGERPRIVGGGRKMEEIVKTAYNNAAKGDVVLLSPACASFDMFLNYKDRGEQFKASVKRLAESV